MNNKNIGGFFEIEIGSADFSYHPDAVALTSGRSCLSLILQTIKPSKIYIPYYICDSALIPLDRYQINYEFYDIDEGLTIKKHFSLKKNEYILYVNYFGLMSHAIDKLYLQYGNRLIIDNTQSFFEKKYHDCWSFNSARKFFGVPDGGYLYGDQKIHFELSRNQDVDYSHLVDRMLEKSSAYLSFLENEKKIAADILQISMLSEKLLSTVDYSLISEKRKSNFTVYANAFSHINQFKFSLDPNVVPFCYPLCLDDSISRELLNEKGIFIPIFWLDAIQRNLAGFAFEKQLSSRLLPLPIDHRYDEQDCLRVIDTIFANL